ncbi:MAG: thymidine phosphorylase [Pirellulaceae bacterium]|nr:thymidine phosphorylase [Pirellulaceae bacterium]
MFASAIIANKRDSQILSREEIEFMINGYVSEAVPDYQMSAWAMAVLCRGMNKQEIADLTECMLNSGIRLQRATERPRVDKHSTGGLGDKTSLILAPLLACYDLDVPMLSGRGLGITGGTLDKLESLAGYRCNLSAAEIELQLQAIGCVITGTTPEITPADRKLYGLRDVTGTVPSIALITASIMSKKLAESLDALVLDVKFGSGAFMRVREDAEQLAESLVDTGNRMHVPTQAILSDMNQPLGRMVGNACEVNESLDILRGGGPSDTRELTLKLCAPLLVAAGKFTRDEDALQSLSKTLDSGAALQRFQQMVEYQSGKFVDSLPLGKESILESPLNGRLKQLDGQRVGQAVIALGGGRRKLSDQVDHQVGLEMLVRLGETVSIGQPLMRIFSRDSSTRQTAEQWLRSALTIEN